MNKSIKLIWLAFILIIIHACSATYYYIKPEIYGHVYDNKTKKPLSNKDGYIGYDLGLEEDKRVRTSNDGKFKITPKAQKYYFIKPNMHELSMSAPQIYINFEGYSTKIFDYSDSNSLSEIENNSGGEILEKIDIGIIYLDPE